MRLRHKPWAEPYMKESEWVINDPSEFKGKWNTVFGNDLPISLEVGMGKGKFIIEHSEKIPTDNFIGFEKQASVQVVPVKNLTDEEGEKPRENLRFINKDAENLKEFFAPEELSRVFVNFPDPWPKEKHAKRRLMYKTFLARYYNILEEGGIVEFKSDQKPLYEFALEQIAEFKKFKIVENVKDLHKEKNQVITTEYENRFMGMGNPIYYIKLIK